VLGKGVGKIKKRGGEVTGDIYTDMRKQGPGRGKWSSCNVLMENYKILRLGRHCLRESIITKQAAGTRVKRHKEQ